MMASLRPLTVPCYTPLMDGIDYTTTSTPVGSRVIPPQGQGWQMASMSMVNLRPFWLPAKYVIVTTWLRATPRPSIPAQGLQDPFNGPLN